MFHNDPRSSAAQGRVFRLEDCRAAIVGALSQVVRITAIAGVTMVLAAACDAPGSEQRVTARTLAEAEAIRRDVLATEARLLPEQVSTLGLEETLDPALLFLLDDQSQAGFERRRLIRIELAERLADRPALPTRLPLNRDLTLLEFGLARLIEVQTLGQGQLSLSLAAPYAIDPFSGAWIDTPVMLANAHRVTSRQDADAFLARLAALPNALDDVRRRLVADQRAGLAAPRAVLMETLEGLERLTADQPGTPLNTLPETLLNLSASVADISPSDATRLAAEAEFLVKNKVRPAYGRLAEELDALLADAPVAPGLWVQADGPRAYRAFLTWHTFSELDPAQLQTALEAKVARERTALDAALDQAALARSEDQGREVSTGALPAAGSQALLTERLMAWSDSLESARNTPIAAASAPVDGPPQQTSASDDALAPGPTFRPSVFPRSLTGFLPDIGQGRTLGLDPTVVEGWPPHLARYWSAEARESQRVRAALLDQSHRANRLIRYRALERALARDRVAALVRITDLSDEGKVGWHHIRTVHAAMAVADLGLHHMKWTETRARTYLIETAGLPPERARDVVSYITAKPAALLATSHLELQIDNLRGRAQAVLGDAYDDGAFQAVLLKGGPRPLAAMVEDVEAWYESLLKPMPTP
ncbi:MAG: DUF885 family protein [Pseudomonadota bacterium]